MTAPELRELAEAATPGPWEDTGPFVTRESLILRLLVTNYPPAIAAYIAAVSPDVVLALLDERAALRQENKRLQRALVGIRDTAWMDIESMQALDDILVLAREALGEIRSIREETNP